MSNLETIGREHLWEKKTHHSALSTKWGFVPFSACPVLTHQTNPVSDPGRQILCLLSSAEKGFKEKGEGARRRRRKGGSNLFEMKTQSWLKL